MKRRAFFLWMVVFFSLEWATAQIPDIRLLVPTATTVCIEGGSCPVAWQTGIRGPVCIEGALGGHDIGILNDCATPAGLGVYDWHIPLGRVTGFGIHAERCARVMIYPKGHPDQVVTSPCFVIEGQGVGHE